MIGMKDTEPVGEHLGIDEDVNKSPGLFSFESIILICIKSGNVGEPHLFIWI